MQTNNFAEKETPKLFSDKNHSESFNTRQEWILPNQLDSLPQNTSGLFEFLSEFPISTGQETRTVYLTNRPGASFLNHLRIDLRVLARSASAF